MSTIDREQLPHYTYEDYLCWEGRWELINGIPYAMTPAPTVTATPNPQLFAAAGFPIKTTPIMMVISSPFVKTVRHR